MWSPNPVLRAAALALALAATAAVSACTVSPVYAPGVDRLELALAPPASRNEQIAYRLLEQRLDFSTALDAPILYLTVGADDQNFGQSRVSRPVSEREMIATIVFLVNDPDTGAVLAQGTRTGQATFQASPQAVANDQARVDARQRAIEAAAEAVRLALLAQFGVR